MTQINQSEIIKQTVGKLRCSPEDRKKFAHSTCMLSISVGQEYHEGNRFLATIRAVSQNFNKCIFLVCDSLQRHNLQVLHRLSANEAYQKSIEEGNKWIKRNRCFAGQLSIPCQIVRWDKWLQHEQYANKISLINDRFCLDSDFQQAVAGAVHEFLGRYKRRNTIASEDEEVLRRSSITYILEECAVLLVMADYEIHYDIYPKYRNDGVAFIFDSIVRKISDNILKRIPILFKKKIVDY